MEQPLTMTLTKSNDQVSIKDWYSNANNTLDTLQLADGKTLLVNEVQLLVDAMAQFTPSTAGTISLSADAYNSLTTTLMAAW
jgi:ribonuclease HIII